MQLAQIAETQAVGHQLQQLVAQRYAVRQGGKFHFQSGELSVLKIINKDEKTQQKLHKLLSLFLQLRVEQSYCYFFLKAMLNESPEIIISLIEEQCQRLSEKKSDYQKINHLIMMRQVLLSKLFNRSQFSEDDEDFLDDIRFINQEIIRAIRTWKVALQEKGVNRQGIVYLFKNENYLTKMIIDNEKIVQIMNAKYDTFLKVPNPFFIKVAHNQEKLSTKSINQFLEILSQEKALELRMMIQSPFVKAGKKSILENELVQLRNRAEEQKTQKVKTIFQNQQEMRSTRKSNIITIQSERVDLMTAKNESNIKSLEKLIKIKQIEVLKELNRKKTNPFLQIHQEANSTIRENSKAEPYLSKIQNLKAEIQKNLKRTSEIKKKEPLPKAQSQIKSPKPKIKLISQINSKVNEKQTENKEDNKSLLSRSKSSFYKQSQMQASQKDDRKSKIQRIASVYSSSNLSNRKQAQSQNIRLSIKRSLQKKEDKEKSKSRDEEQNEVKESLTILNKRLREQAIKNIYSNKDAKRIPQVVKISRVKTGKKEILKESIEESKTKQIQAMSSSNTFIHAFQQKIKEKQEHIDELKRKLSRMKEVNSQQPQRAEKNQQQEAIRLNKEKIERQREQLQLQNLRIKQQMKKQELKFLALKEKQYELRQQQLQNKYKFQLQKIKDELLLKNQQWQLKISQQQKKHKESESKIQQIRRRSQMMAYQLQQREIKEKLLSQLYQQEQKKIKKQLMDNQQKRKVEEIMETIKREQEHFNQEMQRKTLENFEEEKLKLNELYLEMKKKNDALADQNMKRKEQLQRMESQKEQQLQRLTQLQRTISQKQEIAKLQNLFPLEKSAKKIQQQLIDEQNDLQELKERVKHELIDEIRKKRRQEEQQEKEYQQSRRQQMQEMQEDIRRVMKEEEEMLRRIQDEYKMKNQQIQKNYEDEIAQSRIAKEKMIAESEETIKRLQHSQPFQVNKLVSIQTGIQNEGNRLKRAISSLSAYELQRETSEFFVEERVEGEEKNEKEVPVEKQPQRVEQKKVEDQEIKNSATEQAPQSPQKQPQQSLNQQKQSPTKPQQLKVTQTIKQNSYEIKEKYDFLLERVSKPIKQIFMSFDQIDTYLNKFYNQLAQEVKEMMPFSRKQVQSIFREKKVDVFDGFNFGLYRAKDKKFTLFGSIQCIPMIASKYGQIQVQQIYIFNKSNNYQKQFLSKQIKIYEKIGYIFQKKTNQEGIYTIKFIVKIPKDSRREINLKDQLYIKTSLRFEQPTNLREDLAKNNCFYYMLGRGLNECLTEQQKNDLALKNDGQSKYIYKRMNDPSFNNSIANTEIVSSNIVQFNISLPIKYIQTSQQPYFTLEVSQYVIKTTEERIYLALYQQSNIAIVIHQMKASDVPEGFSLETYIESKFKQMEKVASMYLFLPVWQSSKKYQYNGNTPKPFTFTQKTHANLVYGSIVKSKVHKGDFIFLQPPFSFLIFEISSAEVLKRMLFGQIVQPEEVLRLKRMIA